MERNLENRKLTLRNQSWSMTTSQRMGNERWKIANDGLNNRISNKASKSQENEQFPRDQRLSELQAAKPPIEADALTYINASGMQKSSAQNCSGLHAQPHLYTCGKLLNSELDTCCRNPVQCFQQVGLDIHWIHSLRHSVPLLLFLLLLLFLFLLVLIFVFVSVFVFVFFFFFVSLSFFLFFLFDLCFSCFVFLFFFVVYVLVLVFVSVFVFVFVFVFFPAPSCLLFVFLLRLFSLLFFFCLCSARFLWFFCFAVFAFFFFSSSYS